MSVTGTGGVALGEDDMMMPEMDDDLGEDLPPMDDEDMDVDVGVDDGMDDDLGDEGMDDDLGGLGDLADEDMGEGGTVTLDDVRNALDACCPENTEEVMAKLEAGGDDEGLEDEDLEDGLEGEGLDDEGLEEPMMGGEDVDDFGECMGGPMESTVRDIANMITEDPDIFIPRSQRK